MSDDYTYWHDPDGGPYIRRGAVGCDVLRDGKWVPVDPAKHGGSIDPWAAKIGSGEMDRVDLEDVPGLD